MKNFKNIHIGSLIHQAVKESNIELSRICNFLKCSEKEILGMYEAESLDTDTLLRWSKLVEYDFFRVYTQHLILYAPQGNIDNNNKISEDKQSKLPEFRKNIYTREVIEFIMELIDTGAKTRLQVIKEYKIPKTTLYKWIDKYKK